MQAFEAVRGHQAAEVHRGLGHPGKVRPPGRTGRLLDRHRGHRQDDGVNRVLIRELSEPGRAFRERVLHPVADAGGRGGRPSRWTTGRSRARRSRALASSIMPTIVSRSCGWARRMYRGPPRKISDRAARMMSGSSIAAWLVNGAVCSGGDSGSLGGMVGWTP